MGVDTVEQHEQLITSLMDRRRWAAGGGRRDRIDTHISTVVLAGELAFKIKKPLDLGFLNFLSLEAREQACLEEVRLNRRLAPALYLGVSRVTGSPDHPSIDGDGATIDWAVRMQRFDPTAILADRVEAIDRSLVEQLAETVATFHRRIDQAPADGPGGAEAACAPMRQNFEQITQFAPTAGARLERLAAWTEARCRALAPVMDRRHAAGFTRECHGDLHLGNVALIDRVPVVFDAIEFNPAFRWIDVINDIAFLVMDLRHRGLDGYAQRFLNRYLQLTGDFDGVQLLDLYIAYRALVRAKIAAIRSSQADLAAPDRVAEEHTLESYVGLARRLAERSTAAGGIVLMHGVSGSGKSVIARQLDQYLPAIVVRSDIERKRLLGLAPDSDAAGQGGYRAEITDATYQRLIDAARLIAASGYVAVLDATFLERDRRQRLRRLADELQVPFAIIACDATEAVLAARIAQRAQTADNVSDADLSVLTRQLAVREPVAKEEADRVFTSYPDRPMDYAALVALFS